jgi:hypothetical protein
VVIASTSSARISSASRARFLVGTANEILRGGTGGGAIGEAVGSVLIIGAGILNLRLGFGVEFRGSGISADGPREFRPTGTGVGAGAGTGAGAGGGGGGNIAAVAS